ncbi:MAG: hypothetical protein AAF591_09125 [Verrucomicrobiota bacterium]
MSGFKLRGAVFVWGPLALSLALTLWGLGDGMRESDQGAVLHGSLEMARGGGSLFGGEYYRLEKQYVSYWLLAAAIKVSGVGLGEDVGEAASDLVLFGNVVSWVVLWSGVLFLVWCGTRGGRVPSGYVGAILLSPVFLLSAPLLATVAISGGLLCVAGGLLLDGKVGWWRLIGLATAVFLAIGARADVVLVLPFICWATSRGEGWGDMLRDGRYWAMMVGAVAGLGGVAWLGGGIEEGWSSFFNVKSSVAYWVFGFGAAGGVYLIVVATIGFGAWRSVGGGVRLFYWSGFVFLLGPIVYYLMHLYTPRYFLLGVWMLLVFCFSVRGADLEQRLVPVRWRRTGYVVCLATALGALLVGVHLPDPKSPRLVLGEGSRYPTADGFWPMGGVGRFLAGGIRNAGREPIDHNQEIWLASLGVPYGAVNESGTAAQSSAFLMYFRLAALLQGLGFEERALEDEAEAGRLFSDERELFRLRVDGTASMDFGLHEQFGDRRWRVLARDPRGTGMGDVICSVEEGNEDLGEEAGERDIRRWLLRGLFRGNDFEMERDEAVTEIRVGRDEEGKRLVLVGRQPFRLRAEGVEWERESEAGEDGEVWHVVEVTGEETLGLGGEVIRVDGGGAGGVSAGWGRLFDYMSLDRYLK